MSHTHTPKMIKSIWLNIWYLSALKKINFILHIFLELFFYCKFELVILWTCFGNFGYAQQCTPKVILTIYRKLSCLSSGRKLTSFSMLFWRLTVNVFAHNSRTKIFPNIGKKSKKIFLGPIWALLLKFGQNWFLWKRRLCQFLNIPIIFPARNF